MIYKLIRPLLFILPPESAHRITAVFLNQIASVPFLHGLIKKYYEVKSTALKRNVLGLTFSNPVGLAAGFDKNAGMINEMEMLGFGFVEVGTVTPLAQSGNPLPRLFRLNKDKALINRMGFNNDGAEEIALRLIGRKSKMIIGVNIGKNKETPNDRAVDDYLFCFKTLYRHADFFTVNVSSPNTPGLRELQNKKDILIILHALQHYNKIPPSPKPILLKISPDLSNEQLDDVISVVKETAIAGVVATNTTTERMGLRTENNFLEKIGNGGLSGVPLRKRSTEIIKYLAQRLDRTVVIIGVGGIHSAEDAWEKIDAGATLVQVFTGLIYEGPGLVKKINRALMDRENG